MVSGIWPGATPRLELPSVDFVEPKSTNLIQATVDRHFTDTTGITTYQEGSMLNASTPAVAPHDETPWRSSGPHVTFPYL